MSGEVDFQILVQKKLFSSESCTCCILASLVEEGHKQNRIVSLVEGQGEYGLFLYAYDQKASKSADLSLDTAFPVTSDFKFSLDAGPPTRSHVVVKISYSSLEYKLEIPNNDIASIFLAELKQAIAVQSQNAGFGLPSTFSWIDKYVINKNTSGNSNPFADDRFVFDDGWPWSQIAASDSNQVVVDHFSEEPFPPSSSFQEFPDQTPDRMSQSSSQNSFNGSSREVRGDSATTFYRALSVEHETDNETGNREYKVRMAMKTKEDEYAKIKFFRVFCGTWNVNGQQAAEPCHRWLSVDAEPPDIYAIGFQELDLSKNAYIFSESAREEEWFKRVQEALHPKAQYKKVKLVRLVGMMLVVFAKKEHVKHIMDVEAAQVATGIMGMLGNKGGVAVRMYLYDTSLCFVNTHLAAHLEEVERRNQDFKNVSSHMSFIKQQPAASIIDHDIVFWIGDLNYRLSGIDIGECKTLIDKGDYQKLMNYDQLCREISAKRVFMEYIEGKINFPPTYKYDPGTDNWDSSEKVRAPAWCDRILWRGSNINQVVYRSHMALKISDHKPVSALFDTGIKIIDKDKYRQVYESIMKNLDKLENEFLPQVSLNKMEVTFSNVKFAEPQYEIISVTNTGKVPLRFEFINKGSDKMFCKPWLTAEPNTAEIAVGHTCDIRIEVYVEPKIAASLTSNSKMEDILVLHLQGGKDLFISVSGSYIPSSFGSSLETLVHMFGPIREVPVATLIDLGVPSSEPAPPNDSRPFDIPKEAYRLVDHIYKHGMDQEDLFQVQGSHKEILLIRDCLDTGTPSAIPGSIHSVAEALVLFLQALPQPVIPSGFHPKCLKNPAHPVLCRQALVDLPVVHRKFFIYICAFLRQLLLPKHAANNKLEVNSLARQFGQLLLGRKDIDIDGDGGIIVMEPSREEIVEDTRKKATFLRHFLTKEFDI